MRTPTIAVLVLASLLNAAPAQVSNVSKVVGAWRGSDGFYGFDMLVRPDGTGGIKLPALGALGPLNWMELDGKLVFTNMPGQLRAIVGEDLPQNELVEMSATNEWIFSYIAEIDALRCDVGPEAGRDLYRESPPPEATAPPGLDGTWTCNTNGMRLVLEFETSAYRLSIFTEPDAEKPSDGAEGDLVRGAGMPPDSYYMTPDENMLVVTGSNSVSLHVPGGDPYAFTRDADHLPP